MGEDGGLSFSLTDAVVAAILLASGGLAFFRGAVREFLSIVAWVGAAAAVYFGFAPLSAVARRTIETTWLADGAVAVGLFLVTLVVLSWFGSWFAERVKESRLGALDRSLGLLFGLARGAVVVCLLYMAVIWSTEPDARPGWLVEARARPLVGAGADAIARLLPPAAQADWRRASAEPEKKPAADAAFESLIAPPPTIDTKDAPGYNRAERKDLDRLIETTE